MNIVFEIQELQQGNTTITELAEKVASLSKKERTEVLDNLEYLAEFNLLEEIKRYL
jgi:hypothetical protein